MTRDLLGLLITVVLGVGLAHGQPSLGTGRASTGSVFVDQPLVDPTTAEILTELDPSTYPADCPEVDELARCVAPRHRLQARGEFLLWFLNDQRVPALGTTAPATTPITQAGVLGQPNTLVIFGDEEITEEERQGGRGTISLWLGPTQAWGIEGEFFMVEELDLFRMAGDDPVLARPFFNTARQTPDAQLVTYPDFTEGELAYSAHSSEFVGGHLVFLRNVHLGCNTKFDIFAGYQNYGFDERISIEERITSRSTTSALVPGTTLNVRDDFFTENRFHGLALGMLGEWRWGILTGEAKAKVSVGGHVSTLRLDGATTVTVPGVSPVEQVGGFLNYPTRITDSEEANFVAIPQLDLSLALQLTRFATIRVGYTFIFWYDAVRPVDQIPSEIDPRQLPPGSIPGSTPLVVFPFGQSDFWVNGLSLGADIRF